MAECALTTCYPERSERGSNVPYEITNPHFMPGNISGSALVDDATGETVDVRYGIRVGSTKGHLVSHPESGDPVVAYTMVGLVDDFTTLNAETVRGTFLLTPQGAAHVITELTDLLRQLNPDTARQFLSRLQESFAPALVQAPQEHLPPCAGDRLVAGGTPEMSAA